MSKPRLSILLGAGATCECTGITTTHLTNLVIQKKQTYFDSITHQLLEYPILNFIYDSLVKRALPDELVTFEDILHTLEMLESYHSAQNPHTVKDYRSVFSVFTNLKPEFADILPAVYAAENDLIQVIIQEIASHENDWQDAANHWFKHFFQDLAQIFDLDIFTLNYDSWLEHIFNNQYTDGYCSIDSEYFYFDPQKLYIHPNLHTINHLHGQICFTSHSPNPKSHLIYEDPLALFKVKDFSIIQNTPFFLSSMLQTQSGEHLHRAPIISGLRKTEKISIPPYDAYYHHLYDNILNSPRLLIIGYSFGDLYLNSLLKQFTYLHPKNGKAIIIDYANSNNWCPFLDNNSTISHNTKDFLAYLYREPDLYHRIISWERPDFWDSQNKKHSLFLCGFKNAAQQYSHKIKDMLR